MEQYIPKSTAVAVIEKFMYDANLEADIASTGECFNEEIANAKYKLCKQIKDEINTLEVKEVDLEKKKMEWIEQLCKYFKVNYLYVSGHESFISDFRRYAKNLK